MNVGAPGRVVLMVPDALQVVGEIHASAGSDEHVSSVLEVELFQRACVCRCHQGSIAECGVVVNEFIRWKGIVAAEVNLAPVEEGLVVSHMAVMECRPRFFGRCIDGGLHACGQRGGIHAADVTDAHGVVVRSGSQQHQDFVGSRDGDAILVGRHGAACGYDFHAGIVLHHGHGTRIVALAVGVGRHLPVRAFKCKVVVQLAGL